MSSRAAAEGASDDAASLVELFPRGTTVDERGLVIAGCAATDLARTYATPTLVIDESALRQRARAYASGLARRWANSRAVWASKSLPCTG